MPWNRAVSECAADAREALHPAEIADLLEMPTTGGTQSRLGVSGAETSGEVLLHVNAMRPAGTDSGNGAGGFAGCHGGLDLDDLADILPDLPDAVSRELLHSMDMQNRQRLERCCPTRRTAPAGV
ncbi:MAG: hypothetical protein R3F37_13070 [Candidatus Competibacteraceae bacterium]